MGLELFRARFDIFVTYEMSTIFVPTILLHTVARVNRLFLKVNFLYRGRLSRRVGEMRV